MTAHLRVGGLSGSSRSGSALRIPSGLCYVSEASVTDFCKSILQAALPWVVSLLLVGCYGDESGTSHLRSTLDLAEQAEQRLRHAEAHHLYAQAVQQSIPLVELPTVQGPRSPNNIYLWIGTLLSAYSGEQTPSPNAADTARAFRRLRELERQIDRQDNRFAVGTIAPLTVEAFVDRLRQILVPDQPQLPPRFLEAAERAYHEGRFSLLLVQDDRNRPVSGLLYSPEYRRALPLHLERDSTHDALLLLPPGSWSVLSWSGPEYAASYFMVPAQPHELTMRMSGGS